MTVPIFIRPGVPGDAELFYKLDHLIFPPRVAFSLELFHFHLQDPDSINLVAEKSVGATHKSPMPGFIVAHVFDESGQVVTMDVHPDYRRQGIGNRLLIKCEMAMMEMGAKESLLQVAVDNEPAKALYKQNGYRDIWRLEGYYPDPAPSGTDAIYMEKKL